MIATAMHSTFVPCPVTGGSHLALCGTCEQTRLQPCGRGHTYVARECMCWHSDGQLSTRKVLVATSDAQEALQHHRARLMVLALAESAAQVEKEKAVLDAFPGDKTAVQKFLYPDSEQLPNEVTMPIWDHLEELRERVLLGGLAAVLAIGTCFAFSKELIVFLEAPVIGQVPPCSSFTCTFEVSRWAGEVRCRNESQLQAHVM